ncbi:Tetracenomycin polyketide synthesis hydroxylase TcmG [Leucoagaricus sp. SymC.cos]|nr:Tetracenomycin polyketide synthesis hydroxylase TcmG [Leucoagaricus sp. SymC.cos]
MADVLPVLIAGAGGSGLVAALILAQSGIKIRIIDKAEKPHCGSRGFGIQPRTCELFQTLGVQDDVEKRATAIPTMRAYKLPGGTIPVKTWTLYPETGTWPDRPFGNGICVSQEELEDVMRQHLKQYGVVVEYGKGLVSIEQDADSVVSTIATFANGKETSEQEKIRSQYLLGTDGAKGVSRKLLGLTFQGETRDTDGMVWGDVEIDGLTPDYWHVWGNPEVFTIMARPITPGGKKFGIGIIGKNFDPTDLADEAKAKEFITNQTGRTDLKFSKFSWLSYFKPNMRMVNKFQEGRAFVVGDAAHVHSPTGAQGINCSIQDATNITWKLALVLKDLASPSILSTYNDERLPIIAQMLRATSQLYTHLVATPEEKPIEGPSKDDDRKSGWLRWRNSPLQLYGVNYRFSDIVLEKRDPAHVSADKEETVARAYAGYEASGSLLAGDRAPEAPGLITATGEETCLFKNYLKPVHHTVMVFASDAEGVGSVLEQEGKWLESVVKILVITKKKLGEGEMNSGRAIFLVDSKSHAADAYHVEKEALNIVVVRPDGYVGAVVKDAEGANCYFRKIFRVI